MNVRFQKTPRGEVAILPRKEYETLVAKAAEADENAGTARLVARARREITSGTPLLPKEVVDRMANGENPVRVLREWRGRTATATRPAKAASAKVTCPTSRPAVGRGTALRLRGASPMRSRYRSTHWSS